MYTAKSHLTCLRTVVKALIRLDPHANANTHTLAILPIAHTNWLLLLHTYFLRNVRASHSSPSSCTNSLVTALQPMLCCGKQLLRLLDGNPGDMLVLLLIQTRGGDCIKPSPQPNLPPHTKSLLRPPFSPVSLSFARALFLALLLSLLRSRVCAIDGLFFFLCSFGTLFSRSLLEARREPAFRYFFFLLDCCDYFIERASRLHTGETKKVPLSMRRSYPLPTIFTFYQPQTPSH